MVRKSAVHIANRRQIAGLCSSNVLADRQPLQWISVGLQAPFGRSEKVAGPYIVLSLFKREHASTSCSFTDKRRELILTF